MIPPADSYRALIDEYNLEGKPFTDGVLRRAAAWFDEGLKPKTFPRLPKSLGNLDPKIQGLVRSYNAQLQDAEQFFDDAKARVKTCKWENLDDAIIQSVPALTYDITRQAMEETGQADAFFRNAPASLATQRAILVFSYVVLVALITGVECEGAKLDFIDAAASVQNLFFVVLETKERERFALLGLAEFKNFASQLDPNVKQWNKDTCNLIGGYVLADSKPSLKVYNYRFIFGEQLASIIRATQG